MHHSPVMTNLYKIARDSRDGGYSDVITRVDLSREQQEQFDPSYNFRCHSAILHLDITMARLVPA
jgi:hypothetical protein